jgi:general secretion pathway protein A
MYNKFFGLQSSPFGTGPDPRYLFMMPHVQEALACLEYGIRSRKGFIVLTGEVGTGKTTILRRAIAALDPGKVSTAFVVNPSLDVLDFFELLLADFGLKPLSRTKSGMLLQLNRWLADRYRADGTCVLVIDEAQDLSPHVLEEIRLLTNLESDAEKLLQIVLCGQPELEEKLLDPSVRQLRQRVSLWARTQPLTAEQTRGYVSERLRIAGARSQVFSPAAMEVIFRLSKGIPRIINLVCEHALLAAFVEQLRQVPAEIVELVGADLQIARGAKARRSPEKPRARGNTEAKRGSEQGGGALSGAAESIAGARGPRRTAGRDRGHSLGRNRHFASLRGKLAQASSRLDRECDPQFLKTSQAAVNPNFERSERFTV